MKQVQVYELNSSNFTKTGKLHKRAQPEIGLTISDHLDGKDHSAEDTKYIADRIKKAIPNIQNVESPYIFTHIRLTANEKTYLVFEHVRVGGNNIITSPTKLLEELKK